MGKVVGDIGDKKLHDRVQPWYCFLDCDKLKSNNIQFFDAYRVKKSKQSNVKVYDVGSTMFEDIQKNNLLIGDVSLEHKYFKHYVGMSWYCQKYNPLYGDTDIDFGGTHDHKFFWNVGQKIRQQYDIETEYLKDIDITSAFK